MAGDIPKLEIRAVIHVATSMYRLTGLPLMAKAAVVAAVGVVALSPP